MSVKAGTLRKERGHAMQGQRDMRKTNRELTKRIAGLEHELEMLVHPMDLAKFRAKKDKPK